MDDALSGSSTSLPATHHVHPLAFPPSFQDCGASGEGWDNWCGAGDSAWPARALPLDREMVSKPKKISVAIGYTSLSSQKRSGEGRAGRAPGNTRGCSASLLSCNPHGLSWQSPLRLRDSSLRPPGATGTFSWEPLSPDWRIKSFASSFQHLCPPHPAWRVAESLVLNKE